tara:strand:- start:296 stop:445 length:150 start_codon:yes stop_codon:yes gene_type:complete
MRLSNSQRVRAMQMALIHLHVKSSFNLYVKEWNTKEGDFIYIFKDRNKI